MAHMKTKIGEYAIILNSKNEFLMLQFNEPVNTWHFAGGRLDEGEEAIEGLIREVKEEANLEIYDLKPIFTKIFTEERKYGVFFIAKVKDPYEVKISDEHQNFKWFKKSDLDSIDFWQPFYKKMLEDNL
jgi:8-oxo-dGTP diphosphatase